jgi:hypothetical protein
MVVSVMVSGMVVAVASKHARHVCWQCDGPIKPDQPEEQVALKHPPSRYRHARPEDCMEVYRQAYHKIGPGTDPLVDMGDYDWRRQ